MILVSVVNWKNALDTINCVRSLLEMNLNQQYKIAIIDNASPDDSYSSLLGFLQDMKSSGSLSYSEVDVNDFTAARFEGNDLAASCWLIQSGENKSYAGGNNLSLKACLNGSFFDYVWVLNNDVEVDQNALQALLDKMSSHANYGICGSKLVYFDDRSKMQALAGGTYSKWIGTTEHYLSDQEATKHYDEAAAEAAIDYIVGASLLIPKPVIENAGLLSEDYFLYYEELDYCERVKRLGYALGVAVESSVYHKEGASTGSGKSDLADYYSTRSRVRFMRRFHKGSVSLVWLSMWLVAARRIQRRRWQQLWDVIKLISIDFFSRKCR